MKNKENKKFHIKKFNEWNTIKKKVDGKKEIPVKNREIWWMSVGENIGFEQDGKNELFERPVLVFKVFNKNMFLGIPLTSGQKNKKSRYYFETEYNNKKYFLILTQVRLFSTKRILRKIRKLDSLEFKEVKKVFKKLINL